MRSLRRSAVTVLALSISAGLAAIYGAPAVADDSPTSRFRLSVRYTFDSAVSATDEHAPLQTEHVSGRVRTGFSTPWGQFVQAGVSQYDSTARTGEFLWEESYWQFHVDRVDVDVRVGRINAGTGLSWVRAHEMTGVQLRRGAGRRAIDTIDAITPDPALLATVDPSEWSWEATALPFASVSGERLLAGETEFGVQSGYMRDDFIGESVHYPHRTLSSGGIRHGLSDSLTAEGYVAAADNWLNRGAGVVADLGQWGRLGASASASRYRQRPGNQWMAMYSGDVGSVRYFASTQHRSTDYVDAYRMTRRNFSGGSSAYHRLHSLGVSMPSPALNGRLRVNYLHVTPGGIGSPHSVLNIAHSASLPHSGQWYAGGFASAKDHDYGLFIGFSIPLGRSAGSGSTRSLRGADRSARPASSLRQVPVSVSGSGSYDFSGRVRMESSLSRNYAQELLQ